MTEIESYNIDNNEITDLYVFTNTGYITNAHLFKSKEYYLMYISEEYMYSFAKALENFDIKYVYLNTKSVLTYKIGINKKEHDKLLMWLKMLGVKCNN